MFSNKTNILQLVSLMLQYGIRHVVLSPGSRNAPLIHTFTQHPGFTCYTVVDERSAAFFALGLSQKLQQPVAACCTSGTALLNYGPAIAEAYYQEIPLLVISADRPEAWIGQADGQTIPQNGTFAAIAKKSVQLPEPANATDEWYCNRLINEALIQLTANGNGPVHINVPLSEPLYQFITPGLPEARKITFHTAKQQVETESFQSIWNTSSKRMIVVGQLPPNNGLDVILSSLLSKGDAVLLAEQIGNVHLPQQIANFDLVLASLSEEESNSFAPDLLITLGGHLTSKRLKQLLRKHKPQHHWDIRPDGNVKDTFQTITDLLPADAADFLQQLAKEITPQEDKENNFSGLWQNKSTVVDLEVARFMKEAPFSDLTVVNAFIQRLPQQSTLHLSSSAPIRYAQISKLNPTVSVLSNRGTNGIDGSMSTAVGYAAANKGLTFLLIGDLSFFYDINALWNKQISKNLRILLVNNGGGNMFHLINGPQQSEAMEGYIACHHNESAKDRVLAFGLHYLSATNFDELDRCLPYFCNPNEDYPMVLEVFSHTETNAYVFSRLFEALKHQ
ncbi:2-succinyl-5-enolpyruvyl-6-hydroxy-3-cyclohexene-1-carboxylic-acid synthase [Paludibacter jiangxiensis]|uniref:2-succinyl-5-enolpyruvyl-6-hydroxy-3-cyclohexene-1-carboxylate synthase n=1 Tax=Paludibacter jiangxiensis TaxID=681398 RepID=A0A170YUY0_9BACT|nr:2-succinyl-5-enolpyruvyl-6-hydroxy-3-cyclohexene-1-carboxylic-acid synthase [Paludibacter jiangxiensis]GAT62084.1 2-succinyl-5-enolpyruvyl-6-hydroxy-3-cyclohexene-1-carboxylate synthase [Paludibacter jiangxiensis]